MGLHKGTQWIEILPQFKKKLQLPFVFLEKQIFSAISNINLCFSNVMSFETVSLVRMFLRRAWSGVAPGQAFHQTALFPQKRLNYSANRVQRGGRNDINKHGSIKRDEEKCTVILF